MSSKRSNKRKQSLKVKEEKQDIQDTQEETQLVVYEKKQKITESTDGNDDDARLAVTSVEPKDSNHTNSQASNDTSKQTISQSNFTDISKEYIDYIKRVKNIEEEGHNIRCKMEIEFTKKYIMHLEDAECLRIIAQAGIPDRVADNNGSSFYLSVYSDPRDIIQDKHIVGASTFHYTTTFNAVRWFSFTEQEQTKLNRLANDLRFITALGKNSSDRIFRFSKPRPDKKIEYVSNVSAYFIRMSIFAEKQDGSGTGTQHNYVNIK
jgi:hypothetical protein